MKFNLKVLLIGLFLCIPAAFVFQNCSNANFSSVSGDQGKTGSSIADNSDLATEDMEYEDPSNNAPLCNDPNFASENLSGECLFLMDTFDRSSIIGAAPFKWTSIIDDELREDNQNVQANIFKVGEHGFGEAAHEEHAVYITGRKGGSVHEVFLMSVPLDLTVYNEMRIVFNYLPIRLEDWTWNGNSGLEHIRLDVCSGNTAECGVDDSLSDRERKNALASDFWKTVYHQPGYVDGNLSDIQSGQNLIGRNHIQNEWLSGEAVVNLDDSNLIGQKSKVIFRLTVLIDEGFKKERNNLPDFSSDLEDAMGIDHVRVYAKQIHPE